MTITNGHVALALVALAGVLLGVGAGLLLPAGGTLMVCGGYLLAAATLFLAFPGTPPAPESPPTSPGAIDPLSMSRR